MVGSRKVGDGAPCLIVGEVAQAHEGSLSLAHAYLDAIADAGADAVKFQAHSADECGPDEPWRVEPRWKQDANRQEYWRRMSFTERQWWELAAHARSRGLAFIVSPFGVDAVDMLRPYVDAWKLASGEIKNVPLIEAMRMPCYHASTGRYVPIGIIASSGMSNKRETYRMMETLGWLGYGKATALLHCVSLYPTPADKVNLRRFRSLRQQYKDCPVGISDHSGTIWPAIAAAAIGASILEVHVTFSREMQGFDTSSSITTQELRQLVDGVRFIEKARQPVDKDAMAVELAPMRALFMDKHKRKAQLA
jgi:N,N'-diacetyllegionaminate synthase